MAKDSGADNGPRVWLFMADGRNTQDLRDLDHLDAILWGANRHARRGDIVLIYLRISVIVITQIAPS
jgi:hypothetical protein